MCEAPPSPRANFTVTSLPTGDMVLFGGEYFDGQDAKCFNELFRLGAACCVLSRTGSRGGGGLPVAGFLVFFMIVLWVVCTLL